MAVANFDEGEEEASIWEKPSRGEKILIAVVVVAIIFGKILLIILFPGLIEGYFENKKTQKRIGILAHFYYAVIALLALTFFARSL